MKQRFLYRIITAFALLLIGASIYLLFRQDAIFVSWIDADILQCLRIEMPDNYNGIFTYIFLYCLPDALWYAALLVLQKPFVRYGLLNKILFYVCVTLPFAMEMLQYLGLMPGTFDWFDILTYFITLIIILLCERVRFCNLR